MFSQPVTQWSVNSPSVEGTSSFTARSLINWPSPRLLSAYRALMPAMVNSSTINHG